MALFLRVNLKTIARKLVFLGTQALHHQEEYLSERLKRGDTVLSAQLDEMETSERSKLLPLSIPLVVEQSSRKILGFRVCEMPANGPLAHISRLKYGPRRDDREMGFCSLLESLAPYLATNVKLLSDQKPQYPKWIKSKLPQAQHSSVKGRRGCVVGQGELKKIGHDPLFDLNHTCAMFRANINRLARRTWCTTKRRDRLVLHIALYVKFHNEVLTA
jgi:hypothetical protein